MTNVNRACRARYLEEWLELAERTARIGFKSREKLSAFTPQPTDIFISPFAKCGTTWLQQTTHGLRSRGDRDFEEITEVSPWIEMADQFGWDLQSDQSFSPRIFKSHLDYDNIPKGGKYICSFRNPLSHLLSFYRFLEGWWFEPGAVSLDEFAYETTLKEPKTSGYFFHLTTWLTQKHNPNVLLLTYESMIANFDRSLANIARFMDIELDDELIGIVKKQSSREFMLQHKSKFDEHLNAKKFEALGLAPMNPATSKITSGTPKSERYSISDELKEYFQSTWKATITEQHQIENYEQLVKTIETLS